jgi:hypothetical protein
VAGIKKGEMTKYCITGHDLLDVKRECPVGDGRKVAFRGTTMDITDIAKILAKESNMEDEVKDAEEKVKDAEEKVKDAEEKVKDAEEKVKDAEVEVKDA